MYQGYSYNNPAASGYAQAYPSQGSSSSGSSGPYVSSSAPVSHPLPSRPNINAPHYTVDTEIPYPEGYVPKPKSSTDDKTKKKASSSSTAAASASSTLYPPSSSITPNYAAAFANRQQTGAQAADDKKKKKKALRAAGGEVWEDPTLQEWDPSKSSMSFMCQVGLLIIWGDAWCIWQTMIDQSAPQVDISSV
jgi:cell division septation protein DedD